MEAYAGFAVVKPQVAFFEAYGVGRLRGAGTHDRRAAARGVLVLADAKRGDIGTTMAAYAAAWAADRRWRCDAVTASPYLGFGSLQPLLDTAAAARTRGVRAGGHVQSRRVRVCSRPPAPTAARWRSRSSTPPRPSTPADEPGSVGVVVGATLTAVPDVSALGGPVLVPGVGAQGGRPEALAGLGGALPGQLLPAVSREVLRAGPDVTAVRAAAERMRDAVAHLA